MLLYKKQLNAAQETIDINKEQIDELAVKKSDLKESVSPADAVCSMLFLSFYRKSEIVSDL